MKKTLLGLSAVALMATGTIAIAQDGPRQGGKDRWAEIDGNKDGKLSQAEMLAHADARFAKADANNDGKIDKADRELHMAQRQAKMWEKLDANGDNSVSKAEFDAAHAERQAKRAERQAKRGEGAEKGERRGKMHRGKRGGRGGMMALAMADTNNDKAVTREEMRAMATTHFAKIDADNDGFVTQAEMRAEHVERRGNRKMRGRN